MVLIISIATGTFTESSFDTKVAKAYVYEAPWFNAWMIILAINLAAAAWSRYPWKAHHAGFVITHAGIITLLGGALVGRIWGVEGTMTLFEGQEPSHRLIIDETEVHINEGKDSYVFPIDISYRHASPTRTIHMGQAGDWSVDAIDYSNLLLPVSTAEAATTGGAPAVQVRLWTGAREVKQWLWPDDPADRSIDMGLMAIETRHGTAPGALQAAPVTISPKNSKVPTSVLNHGPVAPLIAPSDLPAGDRAIVYLADNGKLTYLVQDKFGNLHRGDLEVGKPVATSWSDWQMEVLQFIPQATPTTDFTPLEKTAKISPMDRANCTEGLKIRVTRGSEQHEEWFASGWQVSLPVEPVPLDASFGPKIFQLPISLELKQFDVEREEGTDTPAGFKSTIEVRDAVGNSAIGSCSMNEPMNFPDSLWRTMTGLTYKVSQASWNPQNLKQSSVQVLLDPGWLFKWTGSLMICCGIFTMFYLRPPRPSHP